MKKLFKKHGATVIFYGGIISLFALGFILGMYGRSAPDVETAEMYTEIVSRPAASKPEPEPTVLPEAEQDEPEKPNYTEITVTATAYCPCAKCCGKTDGITATGTQATAGRTIAVDPSVIPYGTHVIIDGVTYVAEDCGGAVKGNDVDIFFNTHDEALQFGRRVLTAYVLK
jgi:3D (Asp-Asp-Asp) domain-containing protein